MAGKIKLDGTQFLEKVSNEFKITNSELKLKSTGNTIVDSSGNAVVSESGGNVALGNVRLPSTGGIKDSSGNNILTESGGNVSVGNVRLPATGGIKDSSGNNVLSEANNVVSISSGVQFPAGHVIQTKYTPIAAYTSSEALHDTNHTVRGKTPITISAGNSIIVETAIDEINHNTAGGDYITIIMNVSTSDPGTSVGGGVVNTGRNDFYSAITGQGNLNVTLGYYAYVASSRISGLNFITSLNNPGAGTYYIWFHVYNAGSNSSTFSIGTNGESKVIVKEIVGTLS